MHMTRNLPESVEVRYYGENPYQAAQVSPITSLLPSEGVAGNAEGHEQSVHDPGRNVLHVGDFMRIRILKSIRYMRITQTYFRNNFPPGKLLCDTAEGEQKPILPVQLVSGLHYH